MTDNLEIHAKCDRDEAKRKHWPFRLILHLAMTYVSVRAAIAVLALTYSSIGVDSMLVVIFCAVTYFAAEFSIVKLGWPKDNENARWLWIKGMPGSLMLGIIALIVAAFSEPHETDAKAYPLRIWLVLIAIDDLVKFSNNASKILQDRPNHQGVARQQSNPLWARIIGPDPRTAAVWRTKAKWTQFLLAANCVIASATWTYLVIHSESFLAQSSWVMASAWLYLTAAWGSSIIITLWFTRWQGKSDKPQPICRTDTAEESGR